MRLTAFFLLLIASCAYDYDESLQACTVGLSPCGSQCIDYKVSKCAGGNPESRNN